MFKMFTQLFAAFTAYFVAFEKTANAAVHLSTWAEESAGAFADEARIQRESKRQQLMHQAKVTEKQLNAVK